MSHDVTLLTDHDLHLFNEGTHFQLHDKLGAHPIDSGGHLGVYFAVWAPNAKRVCVQGDFNGWNPGSHPLRPRERSGIWEGFIPGLGQGSLYKYRIESHHDNFSTEKADPFAFAAELPPKTASVVWTLAYDWKDRAWMENRSRRNAHDAPVSIYEVHLGSWRRVPEEGDRFLTYRELAPKLAEYAVKMGFTHVEFLPVMEHPFYGSWGYQTTGYFAPTSRHGSPQDFMFLIDTLHQHGLGVLLDWVPSHFPSDAHGLGYFDGTHLYEHADPRQGWHPDWGSLIFNYNRNEVRSFLISNALFWLERYHADGLRVDAVASMLYLDYSRKSGEWIPNAHGGRENLSAIDFIRKLNEEVYRVYPDVQTVAEESTAWGMVSRPTYVGGLGFGMKWDMGWMHDTLLYLRKDPVHRRFHQDTLSFRMIYAFHENFVLPLSHDEVVHGKGSLLGQMSGDEWQKFANLRLLYGYMFAQPGKKLLFMGGELGQWREWRHETSLDWHLLDYAPHQGLQRWVSDLNRVYRAEPALHRRDFDPSGFEWIDCNDADNSVLTFLRRDAQPEIQTSMGAEKQIEGSSGSEQTPGFKGENMPAPRGRSEGDIILAACNFTPVPRHAYRVGVPRAGRWAEILNGDSKEYGGSGMGNLGGVVAERVPFHGRDYSLRLTLPPLSVVFLKTPAPQAR